MKYIVTFQGILQWLLKSTGGVSWPPMARSLCPSHARRELFQNFLILTSRGGQNIMEHLKIEQWISKIRYELLLPQHLQFMKSKSKCPGSSNLWQSTNIINHQELESTRSRKPAVGILVLNNKFYLNFKLSSHVIHDQIFCQSNIYIYRPS